MNANYTDTQLEGVVVEHLFHWRAKIAKWQARPGPKPAKPARPLSARLKDRAGHFRTYSNQRIRDCIAAMAPIVEQAERFMTRDGLTLRGGDSVCRLPSGRLKNVDARLSWRNHKVVAEIKFAKSIRKAKSRAAACVEVMDRVRRGEWQGPHPRAQKNCRARYTATIALSKSALYVEIQRAQRGVRVINERLRQQQSGYQHRAAAEQRPPAAAPARAAAQRQPYDSDDEDTDSVPDSDAASSVDC